VLQQFSFFVQGLIATPTQFDQTIELRLGDISIASAAAPAFNFQPPPPPATGFPAPGGPSVAPNIVPPPGNLTQPGQPGGGQGGPLAITPVAAVAVPAAMIVFALLWMLAGAIGLDRMAGAATSSVAAETCPLEKP
jgi:hypothetical protein